MIWSLIPDWLITAAAAGLTGFVALLVGRWTGKREGASQARADRAESNAKAAKDAKDTRHELETADDQHLVDILTGRRKL